MSSRATIRNVISQLVVKTKEAGSLQDLAQLLSPLEQNKDIFVSLKENIADFIKFEILHSPKASSRLALSSFGLLVIPEPVCANIFRFVGEIYDLMNMASACRYTQRVIRNPRYKCFISPRITFSKVVPARDQIFEIRIKKNEIHCRQSQDVEMRESSSARPTVRVPAPIPTVRNMGTPMARTALNAGSAAHPPARKFRMLTREMPMCLALLRGQAQVRMCAVQWFKVQGVLEMSTSAPFVDFDFDVDDQGGQQSDDESGRQPSPLPPSTPPFDGIREFKARWMRVQVNMLNYLRPAQFPRLKELRLNVSKQFYINYPKEWNNALVTKIHYAPLLFQERHPYVVQRELYEFPNLRALTIPNDTHLNKIALPRLHSLDVSLGNDILQCLNRFDFEETARNLRRIVIRMILPNSRDENAHKNYFMECMEVLSTFPSLNRVFVFLGLPRTIPAKKMVRILSKWSANESKLRPVHRRGRSRHRLAKKCRVEFGVYAVRSQAVQATEPPLTKVDRLTIGSAISHVVHQVPFFQQAKVDVMFS